MSENLPAKQPVEIEGRNFRRAYRERQSGKLYLIQMEITKELWDLLESIPSEALIGGVLWHHDGDGDDPAPVVEKPQRAKKEKPVKGSYGLYWGEMFKRGFWSMHDLQRALGWIEGEGTLEGVKTDLKDLFGVDSLTFVSPAEFEKWLATQLCFDSLITMSRQCAAKVGL